MIPACFISGIVTSPLLTIWSNIEPSESLIRSISLTPESTDSMAWPAFFAAAMAVAVLSLISCSRSHVSAVQALMV